MMSTDAPRPRVGGVVTNVAKRSYFTVSWVGVSNSRTLAQGREARKAEAISAILGQILGQTPRWACEGVQVIGAFSLANSGLAAYVATAS